MAEISEKHDLASYLELLEAKLNWGSSQYWVNYDFEKLSQEIEHKTGVTLSVTTLKRIWGKVKYPHAPTLTTLNTLAQYLDYDDWRAFTQALKLRAQNLERSEVAQNAELPLPEKRRTWLKRPWLLLAVLLLLTIFAVSPVVPDFFAFKVDQHQYQFKANKIVAEGVPNTVIFNYDASASPTDSVYIVQTWDMRRKTRVPKDKHAHSAIYYYPGFFRTKLIVGNSIVKTHDLQISSDGWLALVEQEPVPIYFKKEDYLKADGVDIGTTTLKKYNLALLPNPPKIRVFNQGDMGELMNDNFTFETTVKNAFSEGSNACQFVEVLIQCKDDIIIIPLADKACAGDLRIYAAGAPAESKYADLSGFGCDLNEWTTLKVVTKDKKMSFYVNGKKAHSLTFPNTPTGIVGVQYRFNGLGAVKDAKFSHGDFEVKL
ncbi:hypothetical protein [Haliscomenobacter hydrossis]|uniref:Uncharacterized protein n=1 Tax=Haliscomenobacter hydrossis (strain ATCC 27775 / DSM 1100 / LMG 10767 / O) TaxID=760192 RepID=F4KSQ4_HALH1|nr:hypothetical protein [Haliscomenobacter hydrossis]AEE48018.1 hypothetical protein Halhy_0105 [Haliscomenobacter hydrossis DSM 1100]